MYKLVFVERATSARKVRFSETLLYRLDRFVSLNMKVAESRLREVSGMSFSQFLVLMALLERGESKQSTIASYVGVTPAVITKQVEQMAGEGWLQLGPSHTDRRANVVRLTAKGQREAQIALKEVKAAWREHSNFPDHYRQKLGMWLDLQDL